MVRALYFDEFGGPEVFKVGEVAEPKVGPDSVVVRVTAAGINPVDPHIRDGGLDSLIDHVFPVVAGWDLAGEVLAVGPAVVEYAPGDKVYGYARLDVVQHGTLAEKVAVPQRVLAPAPASVDLTTAAAIPLAGLTAFQLVRRVEPVAGETVLIHGAAGGVGHFAVQLAALTGARVIGSASPGNHEFLRSLGAEPVPYGEGLGEAVRALAPDGVDVVLDLAGGDSLAQSDALVTDKARVATILDVQGAKDRGGSYIFVHPSSGDLRELARLVDDGSLRVEVAETYPLDRATEAFERLEAGHARGKLVITLG